MEWFIIEDPIEMEDLGVPLFLETPIWISLLQTSYTQPSKNT